MQAEKHMHRGVIRDSGGRSCTGHRPRLCPRAGRSWCCRCCGGHQPGEGAWLPCYHGVMAVTCDITRHGSTAWVLLHPPAVYGMQPQSSLVMTTKASLQGYCRHTSHHLRPMVSSMTNGWQRPGCWVMVFALMPDAESA